mmetsp:Transcript_125357/g.250217  ORF Transcript_125357/g.250217 Transcript_125357/m.250217 type:complete len:87 (+) Transcript_125357:96-356(+)
MSGKKPVRASWQPIEALRSGAQHRLGKRMRGFSAGTIMDPAMQGRACREGSTHLVEMTHPITRVALPTEELRPCRLCRLCLAGKQR